MSLSAYLECRDRHDIANNLRKLFSQAPIPTCTLHWPGAKKTLKDTFWGLAGLLRSTYAKSFWDMKNVLFLITVDTKF